MFGIFKSKKKKKTPQSKAEKSAALRKQVQEQIARKRAEMDPETLEKLEQAMRIKKAKGQVRSMIDDDDRRGNVVNEIRHMREDDK